MADVAGMMETKPQNPPVVQSARDKMIKEMQAKLKKERERQGQAPYKKPIEVKGPSKAKPPTRVSGPTRLNK